MADEEDFSGAHPPSQPRRVRRGEEGSHVEGDWPPPEQKAIVEANLATSETVEGEGGEAKRTRRKK